jgi:hypothetical protein
LVEAIEVFRQARGQWPQTLDDAVGLVDDAGSWRYSLDEREFTLETDWRAREAFALRYESGRRVWSTITNLGNA